MVDFYTGHHDFIMQMFPPMPWRPLAPMPPSPPLHGALPANATSVTAWGGVGVASTTDIWHCDSNVFRDMILSFV